MKVIDYSVDPYGVEASQIQRRRQLAELLTQQAVNGGPVYSDRAGIARVLTGILGGIETRRAEKDERGLAERAHQERNADLDRLMEFSNQRPTVGPDLPQKDDEGNSMPGNVEQTSARRMELARALMGSRNPNISQFAMAQLLAKPKEEEAFTLKPGEKRFKGKEVVASVPETPKEDKEPESVRTLKAQMKAAGIDPESPMGRQIFAAALTKSTTHQPAASMTVNTGKKFGETLATNVAEQVAQSADAARGAVDTLNTAKQINDALASGKVMAGPGTSALMFVQQALGAPATEEGRVKTREVIQGLSQMTLAARKQLKGQGQVSDFEGKLLAKAASGDIDNLSVPEIKAIVAAATRLARGAITQHQSYLKKIQSDPEIKGLAPFFDITTPAGGGPEPTTEELLKLYGPK